MLQGLKLLVLCRVLCRVMHRALTPVCRAETMLIVVNQIEVEVSSLPMLFMLAPDAKVAIATLLLHRRTLHRKPGKNPPRQ